MQATNYSAADHVLAKTIPRHFTNLVAALPVSL